uniref:Uncharacterized protein n=1 Tax=Timema poppense TaxID=170557 RepID=A0A7R9H6L6_TIMPO|nr:unnamed protein product [Timema poppensis]
MGKCTSDACQDTVGVQMDNGNVRALPFADDAILVAEMKMKNGAFDEQGAKKMMDSEFKKESERVQKMAELKACLQKETMTTNDPCVSGPTMCACARKTGLM